MNFHAPFSLVFLASLVTVIGCGDGPGPAKDGVPKKVQAKSDDTQLSVFAHTNIPEVERLIDELSLQIVDRQSRLEDLASALRLGQRDPKKDPEYQQWSDAIARLQAVQQKVRDLRADTFIRYRKHLLSPDSEAQGMEAILDSASAGAMKSQEEIASILAGQPAVTTTASTNPVSPSTTTEPSTTAAPNSSISTTITPTPAPAPTPTPTVIHSSPLNTTQTTVSTTRVAVLPLRNTTDVQMNVTQAIFAGSATDRSTVKTSFDQYAHGPRASLANLIESAGGSAIVRSDCDTQLVVPTPSAASRGLDDAGNREVARRLSATHFLCGQIDEITAQKQTPAQASGGRESYAVIVRFRIDLCRASDGAALVSQNFELRDTIIASQFRGFTDATVTSRMVRSMGALVQGDPAFAQNVQQALR